MAQSNQDMVRMAEAINRAVKTPTIQEEPPRFIMSQEEALDKVLSDAHEALTRLCNRLHPICSSEPHDSRQEPAEIPQPCSPLADKLRQRTIDVQCLTGRINGLIDVLEV